MVYLDEDEFDPSTVLFDIDLPDGEIDVDLPPVNPEDAYFSDNYLPEMFEADDVLFHDELVNLSDEEDDDEEVVSDSLSFALITKFYTIVYLFWRILANQ